MSSHPCDILDVPGRSGRPCPGEVQALRPKAIQHPAHAGWIAQFGD